MDKYTVKVSGVFVKDIEIESYSQESAERDVELKNRFGELDLGFKIVGYLRIGEMADGLTFLHPEYQKHIMKTLENKGDNEKLHFRYEPSDCLRVVTKNEIIRVAREAMPAYFCNSMMDVRIADDGYTIEPVFTRIVQAAWDAALSEFYKDKQEWCDKYGCE